MTARSSSQSRWVVLAIAVASALLFVIAGAATRGLGGGLGMAGLVAAVLGTGAFIAGGAKWAFIAPRRIAGIVAAAGVAALVVGSAAATPATTSASSSTGTSSTPTTSSA